MDHSVESYLQRLPTLTLQLLPRHENDPDPNTHYPPEIYDSIRKVLAERQAAMPRSDQP